MRELLLGTTLLASFLAGMVALFAPCCISVMLPAYFAAGFRRRRALVAMTFVFAAGLATVILPIALGATGLSRAIQGHHRPVYLIGAALMVLLGLATLLGWKLALPMPGMRANRQRGPVAVFALGAFSGIATACCAPVLAGVVALSGAAGSFVVALATGVAYVFGMVGPLFALALVWDRRDWSTSRLLRGRTFTWRLRGHTRAVHSSALVSGVLLVAMGALTAVIALTGPSMPSKGWQVTLTARLQHYAHVVVSAASWVPGWAVALALVAAVAGLGALAARAAGHDRAPEVDSGDGDGHDGATPPDQPTSATDPPKERTPA